MLAGWLEKQRKVSNFPNRMQKPIPVECAFDREGALPISCSYWSGQDPPKNGKNKDYADCNRGVIEGGAGNWVEGWQAEHDLQNKFKIYHSIDLC